MDLKTLVDKKVRIIDIDGQEFLGMVTDYDYPEDNEPEEESIIIEDELRSQSIMFYGREIKSLEIIK